MAHTTPITARTGTTLQSRSAADCTPQINGWLTANAVAEYRTLSPECHARVASSRNPRQYASSNGGFTTANSSQGISTSGRHTIRQWARNPGRPRTPTPTDSQHQTLRLLGHSNQHTGASLRPAHLIKAAIPAQNTNMAGSQPQAPNLPLVICSTSRQTRIRRNGERLPNQSRVA